MPQGDILRCARSIFKGFWKWHVDNIGLMAESLLKSGAVGIASIGRELRTQTSPKHAIKRVDRFLSNSKLPLVEILKNYIAWVIGPRRRIGISCDWTKVRDWPVLVASLVYRGRSIPLLWAVLDPKKLSRSWNAFENGFFALLSRLLPSQVEAIVLLDRGFKRVSLLKHLDRCGLLYVVRSGGNTWVKHSCYEGEMNQLIQKRNQIMDLPQAWIRKEKPYQTRVVAVWDAGQKEPWIIVTNIPDTKRQVIMWYGKRFQVEETFRDQKSHRFGLALGRLKMMQADRLERLLLIVAFAQYLVLMVGALARFQGLHRQFQANTRQNRREHSDFFLGLYYIFRLTWHHRQMTAFFYQEAQK